MTGIESIELIASLTMLAGIIGVAWNRISTGKGIGVRTIQFSGIVIGLPVVLILSLENKFDSAAAALMGAVFGYLLSNIGNFDKTDS
jgi:hypothetical protein